MCLFFCCSSCKKKKKNMATIDVLLQELQKNKADPQTAAGHIKQLLIRTGGPTGEKTRLELAQKGGVAVLLDIAKTVSSLAASALLVLNKVSRNSETKGSFSGCMKSLSTMAVEFSEVGNTNASVIAAMTIANVIGSEESEQSEALLSDER